MKGKLEKEGKYELFETTRGNHILALNNKSYFAVVKGKYGDILVTTNADHQKAKSIKSGKFYLANFDDDPEFRDLPHLFLEEGNKFRVWILPNNTPSKNNYQKKLVKTNNLVSKETVEYHVKGSGKKGTEKQYTHAPKKASSQKEADHRDTTEARESIKNRGLGEKSKEELYQLAREAGVEGRSRMNKNELEQALRERG